MERHKILTALAVTVALLLSEAALALITDNPEDLLLWASPDLEGDVLSAAWSPDGSMVAAGGRSGELYVFSRSGDLLWRATLDGYVEQVEWSPDGSMVAAGVGGFSASGLYTRIYVFDSSGSLVWQSQDLDGYISGMEWSPDGSAIAVGTSSGLVYSLAGGNGRILWQKLVSGAVTSLDWSPDGSMLAVGSQWWDSTTGAHGIVYAFDSGGALAWQSDDLAMLVYEVAWSPGGSTIAVSAAVFDSNSIPYSKVYAFDSNGGLLWETALIDGYYLYDIDWSPDGSELAAALGSSQQGSGLLIIYSSLGDVVLTSRFASELYSAAWSPKGVSLALGTSSSRVIIVSKGDVVWESGDLGGPVINLAWDPEAAALAATASARVYVFKMDFGVIAVLGEPGTALALTGPGGSAEFALPAVGAIYLYVDLGVYYLSYELPRPGNYIGDPSVLTGTLEVPVLERTLNMVSLPTTSEILGRLIVKASPDTSATLSIAWDGGSVELALQPGEVVEYYAAPGEYVVSYKLPVPVNFIGDPSVLEGEYFVAINSGSVEEVRIPGYSDVLGTLVLYASDAPVRVTIAWNGGSKSLEFKPSETVVFSASPGTYTVSYEIIVSEDFIGDPEALKGSIDVIVEAGFVSEARIPGYSDTLGVLRLEAGSDSKASVAISWEGGSRLLELAPGEVVELLASPGRYLLEYSLPLPENYVGDPSILNGKVERTIKAGSIVDYRIPGYRDLLGLILVYASSDSGASVMIAWNGGSKLANLRPDEVAEFWASPGDYVINYELWRPANFVGDTDVLKGWKSIRVAAGSSVEVILPSYRDLLGLLELKAPEDSKVIVTVSWEGDSKDFTLRPRDTVEVWASPGEYRVLYRLPEPENFIGNPRILEGSEQLRISRGSKVSVSFPGYSDLLGLLIVRAPADARVDVRISWSLDSIVVSLSAGEERSFPAAPGEYLTAYTIAEPENYVGDPSVLRGSEELEVEAGKATALDIPGYGDLLGSLVIEAALPGTQVTVSWSGGSRLFTVGGEGRLELWAAPGSYELAYRLPEPEGYVGGPEGLAGTLEVEVRAGSAARIPLPGYDDLLGTLVINAPRDAAVTVTVYWRSDFKEFSLEAGSILELPAAPGDYRVAYRLPEPENYVGPSAALAGEEIVSVKPGGRASVTLPGYDSVIGKIVIKAGVDGTIVEILWEGGSRELILDTNEAVVLNAAPGQYIVAYRLPEPENYVGSGEGLRGELRLKVSPGQTINIETPGYQEALAVAVVKAPKGSLLTLESETVRIRFELSEKDSITLLLDPGTYTLTISYMGVDIVKDVTVKQGGRVTLEFREEDFKEKLEAAETEKTGETAGSTEVEEQAGAETATAVVAATQETQVDGAVGTPESPIDGAVAQQPEAGRSEPGISAPPRRTLQDYLGGNTTLLLLLAASAGMASMILLAARRRAATTPASREEPLGDAKEKESDAERPPSLKDIEDLLGRKIYNLKEGIASCENSEINVKMPESIAPMGPRGERYDGEWRCCRLGCGGWGCAYRCQRPHGGESVVFKVPRGLEAMVERGAIPTLDRRLVEEVSREADNVSVLSHEHLLRLLAFSKTAPLLVYEYADGGSLEAQLARGWRPSLREALLVALQLGDALRYINAKGMLHGDVKPDNIFVKDRVVKLGDFSSIVRLLASAGNEKLAFTPGWRAPEQANQSLLEKAARRGLENKIDVYQLGNLLLYLITRETLDGEEASNPAKVEEKLAAVKDERLRRLLREMLSYEPERRPNMERVLEELLIIYKSYEGS